jgi:hypothetical protein
MDDLLPSYESVIAKSPWELIAPYLYSSDLCSAALVCQKWHKVFTPQLWGNPASHFGVENDTVYGMLNWTYFEIRIGVLTLLSRFDPIQAHIILVATFCS